MCLYLQKYKINAMNNVDKKIKRVLIKKYPYLFIHYQNLNFKEKLEMLHNKNNLVFWIIGYCFINKNHEKN